MPKCPANPLAKCKPCFAGASLGSESHAHACMMRVESRGSSDEPLSCSCDSLWMLRLGQDEMEQYCQTLSVPSAVCWERLHPDTESQALEWQAWECFRDGFKHGELISLTSTGQRLHGFNSKFSKNPRMSIMSSMLRRGSGS